MKTQYFENCSTEAEVVKTYRDLSKIHHPDKNADQEKATAIMKEINLQRDQALRRVWRASGLTDREIDGMCDAFVADLFKGSVSKEGINNLVETLGKEAAEAFGDKDPSLTDIIGFVGKKLFGSAGRISKTPNDKKLDK